MTETSEEKPIGPSSNILEALGGISFSKPKHLRKPNGQDITTRLVREGSGMVGLEDRVENEEWAGIFNHYLKVAGASLQIARLLKLNGQEINPQLVLDSVVLSHSGRRQYDEAVRYPDQVDKAKTKQEIGDMQVGLNILKDKDLPSELLEMLSIHASPVLLEATKTWNEKLPVYLDHRIAQNAMSLEQRYIDLKRGVVSGRYSQEFLDKLREWDTRVERELFNALYIFSYEEISKNPENLKARVNIAVKLGKLSQEEADILKTTKLYKPKTGKDADIAGIIGLSADEFLEKLQLYPEDVNDSLLQPERWERYIRRLYINDAEQGIFARLSSLHRSIAEGTVGSKEELEKEFPQDTWWGKYARELYDKRKGVPLRLKLHKQIGIGRAIKFYRDLEQKDKLE